MRPQQTSNLIRSKSKIGTKNEVTLRGKGGGGVGKLRLHECVDESRDLCCACRTGFWRLLRAGCRWRPSLIDHPHTWVSWRRIPPVALRLLSNKTRHSGRLPARNYWTSRRRLMHDWCRAKWGKGWWKSEHKRRVQTRGEGSDRAVYIGPRPRSDPLGPAPSRNYWTRIGQSILKHNAHSQQRGGSSYCRLLSVCPHNKIKRQTVRNYVSHKKLRSD
jgi:hypothetical protein